MVCKTMNKGRTLQDVALSTCRKSWGFAGGGSAGRRREESWAGAGTGVLLLAIFPFPTAPSLFNKSTSSDISDSPFFCFMTACFLFDLPACNWVLTIVFVVAVVEFSYFGVLTSLFLTFSTYSLFSFHLFTCFHLFSYCTLIFMILSVFFSIHFKFPFPFNYSYWNLTFLTTSSSGRYFDFDSDYQRTF